MNVRDRVIDQRKVPASALRPSPYNWRTHPSNQKDALRGILAEIGFAGAELVRQLPDGSLELIDGHLRAEEMGDQLVAVTVTDLTAEEAKKLLAVFDPIGDLATADGGMLAALLAECEFDSPALMQLTNELMEGHGGTEGESGGDQPAGAETVPEKYQILVEFGSEADQAKWLEKLTAEGLQCRSLIS